MKTETLVEIDGDHDPLKSRAVSAMRSGLEWRHHGIGVLQAYVSEGAGVEHRLHIWSRGLLKAGINASGDAHDHRFDMISHVLFGSLAHEEWELVPSSRGVWTTMSLINARQAGKEHNFYGPMTATGKRYDRTVEHFEVASGSLYRFPARRFHRSPVHDFVITWVEKHNQSAEPARIAHPIDIPAVAAFGHETDRSQVDRLVQLAIEVLTT